MENKLRQQGEMMAYAVTAMIEANVESKFEKSFEPSSGSFYLIAIEQDEVILAWNGAQEEVTKIFEDTQKPIIFGSFWEESIDYSYGDLDGENAISVDLNGTFAFELDEEDGLDGYDVDDGGIDKIIIAWAEDGDAPKLFSSQVSVSGALSDCQENDEFDGL